MKHLTTLLLTLLFLGGCSTELDRCIEFTMENLNFSLESDIDYWTTACGDDASCKREIRKEQEEKYQLQAKLHCHDKGIY